MRQPKDAPVLWRALANNGLQVVSTDHCPFWFEGGVQGRTPGKELGKGNFAKIPNGMPGLEERMMVMWEHGVNTGRISPSRYVELMCTNPAKIFGMYPQKGTIAVGSDADLVVWDMGDYRELPYHYGVNLARQVIKRGKVVVDQ